MSGAARGDAASASVSRRAWGRLDGARLWALGNLLPAFVLGAGGYVLPARFLPLDAALTLVVVGLLGASALVFARPALALRALRAAAWTLLTVGLLVFAIFALTASFLFSVHGSYGQLGGILMGLVLLLVLPYAVVYPSLLLLWLGRRLEAETQEIEARALDTTETVQAAQ